MRKWMLVVSVLLVTLFGCDIEKEPDGEPPEDISCLGFNSPSISVFVRDGVNDSQYISNALVTIDMRTVTENVSVAGQFITEEDDLSQTFTNAYFSQLEINASSFDVEITISAEGYLPETTTIENFTVDTSCMADNSISKSVYLTPVESTELYTCAGFMSPDINVFVRDAIDNSLMVDDALVSVVMAGSSSEITKTAQFIPYDDDISNTQTRAYYSLLSINELNFDIELIVSANGYHSAVSKIDGFEVDTSCMADNSVVQNIYLCPLGTDCK